MSKKKWQSRGFYTKRDTSPSEVRDLTKEFQELYVKGLVDLNCRPSNPLEETTPLDDKDSSNP